MIEKCYTCGKPVDTKGWHITYCKPEGSVFFCDTPCMKEAIDSGFKYTGETDTKSLFT